MSFCFNVLIENDISTSHGTYMANFCSFVTKKEKKILANPQRLKMGRQCNTNNPLKIEPFQHI